MEHIEILLLNYLSVLFLTVTLSIFISKPEKISKILSIWFLLSQLAIALLLYKVIQLYNGFHIIYIADTLFFAVFLLGKITNKSRKKNKIVSLAELIPTLHKLSTEEFSTYLTTLLKAYGFQSVRQVQIQNDDPTNTQDHFLLARHEGSLVEIRILNRVKKITEKNINDIASSFRDSTSQATSWLLATSAKADENTGIYVRNSGADIKVFDFKTITNLVYGLAPHYEPSESLLKTFCIKFLDQLLNILNKTRSKLTTDQPLTAEKKSAESPVKMLNDALGDSPKNETSTIELFEENGIESTTEETIEVKAKQRQRKKKNKSNTNQGDLNLTGLESAPPSNTGSSNIDAINDQVKEQEVNTNTVLSDNEISLPTSEDSTEKTIPTTSEVELETEISESEDIDGQLEMTITENPNDIEAFMLDETMQVENVVDPMDSFNCSDIITTGTTEIENLDDFAVVTGATSGIFNTDDILLSESFLPLSTDQESTSPLDQHSTNEETLISHSLDNLSDALTPQLGNDCSIDFSDLGGAIQAPVIPQNHTHKDIEKG